jgi:putative phosphoesterase
MPRIGLLSDSHGRAAITRQAVNLLLDHGAGLLIHLGDVGSPAVLDALLAAAPGQTAPVEAHVVFGNTDADAADLARYAQAIGLQVDHPVGELTVEAQRLVFMHGHDGLAMAAALAQGAAWLCHGHTHRACDRRDGRTRVINPGALFRAATPSVALLDTQTQRLEFFEVERG